MAEKLRVMVLTAEDSLKVFRMTPERIAAALERHPDIRDVAEFRIARTTTSYENTPGWNEADHALFYRDVAEADVLVGYMFPPDDLRAHAPHLRWIHIIGAGIEHLHPLSWLPEGTTLTNNRGAHAPKTREYAMMALLMLGNHMPRLATAQRQGRWDGHFVSVVAGKTVVVVGAGKQGTAVAQGAAALGVRAVGVDPEVREHAAFARIVPPSELRTVLADADFVGLTLPAAASTRRFFGAAEFAAMREGAGFFNISRGSVVDTDALLAALRAGKLSGAVLDVFEEEPLPPDSPLWDAPNLTITPHMGCDDEENYIHRTFDIVMDNLRRLIAGRALENRVDPEKGY